MLAFASDAHERRLCNGSSRSKCARFVNHFPIKPSLTLFACLRVVFHFFHDRLARRQWIEGGGRDGQAPLPRGQRIPEPSQITHFFNACMGVTSQRIEPQDIKDHPVVLF